MNELILLAHIMEDGSLSVQMPDGVDVEATVAAVIRAACARGCDMSKVFCKLQLLCSRTGCYQPEPMVIQ